LVTQVTDLPTRYPFLTMGTLLQWVLRNTILRLILEFGNQGT
jgi:hypothetical protein